ncbi:hypothetical protein CEE37_13795 [candidate division LCP-89 bacterium B3_LCP]|uniref:Glycosyltransferase RgtA/B/C/D-like domain-containing protein n=1 Tax=candidate division LCP-89 bacterium B3_LCP TaxID=2012998 RepID=A0A532URT4_UNCL8|nr:MAG: hypothetical protein CEE37_13795 [candidate division LCP-89 bacterium B3_LCP]
MLKRNNITFALLLLLFIIYASCYISKTSFAIEDEHYFSLFDDAMVSMTYAKNLAAGHGLVWYPGSERVEGYTNPLWVIYMALFHLLPVGLTKVSLFIQISGALFLLINLFFVKSIADYISDNSTFVSMGTVALTAFYYSLNTWSLQGMEVSILTLITTATVWMVMRNAGQKAVPVRLFMLLGIATLIRMDMIVLFLAILGYLVIFQKERRWQNFLWGISILVFFMALQTLLRWWYYGDILPNTYYLKLTGYPLFHRITRGLYAVGGLIHRMDVIFFLLPFAVILFRRDRYVFLLLWVFLTQLGYSIYVGGDAWEHIGITNRYVASVMPLLFILLAYSLQEIRRGAMAKCRQSSGWIRAAMILVLIFALFRINLVHSSAMELLLINPPLYVSDNKQMVEKALLVKDITEPQAKTAITWAGAFPYFSNRPVVDLLGKNDRKIAHLPMRSDPNKSPQTAFYPGHMKWDYEYSIGELKPDIVLQTWSLEGKPEAEPYLSTDYEKVKIWGHILHLLKSSPYIRWDKINRLSGK